jgi:trimethylamine--corrinoid protein Co-methyltransferase
MYDRMQTLTHNEMIRIHKASIQILNRTGIAFNEPDAIDLFNRNDFKTDDCTVFFTEEQIIAALRTTPSRFKLFARAPEKSVFIGGEDWVFAPTYGAPYLCDPNGEQRLGAMEDYDKICKLVQTSRHINMNGFKHVAPSDIAPSTAYLYMLFSNIVLCDKPFMGSTDTREAARDSVEMAGLVFGGKEKFKEMPVMAGLINPFSPLRYTEEMAGSILEFARYRQPLIIVNMIMAGTSGPIQLPGLLALMNAEILAGLVLSQLAGPGTPVIYGTSSCPTNMQTGGASIGAPETNIINSATTQLARYYGLPCRTGGSLTDSLVPDAQALAEGALSLLTSVRNGAHFVLHACGTMGSYIGNSLEKWLIDEELCGMVREMMKPVDFCEETIDVQAIHDMGIGGNYLMDPATLKHCRTAFFQADLFNKGNQAKWKANGGKTIEQTANDRLVQRLASYEKPEINPDIENALFDYVCRRKDDLLATGGAKE